MPSCGDGHLDDGEECDDGNVDAGDGCSPQCKIVDLLCGNGALDGDEECDDGDSDPSDECTTECQAARCGDGYVQAGVEVCDGDGCYDECSKVRPILQATGFCALLFDGRVKCWGPGLFGVVGLEDDLTRGDEPGEMGENLPVVNLGTGAVTTALSSGFQHNCALLTDGRVKCWGANGRGQLGQGHSYHVGRKPGDMGDNLPAVELGTGKYAVAINVARAHSCALLNDDSLKCWGYNQLGQLGLGDIADRGIHPGEMGDDLPAIDLGTGRHAVQVAPGGEFTCALLDDSTVKCWGGNYRGQLGQGNTTRLGDDPGEMGDALPTVDLGTDAKPVAIAAGGNGVCATLEDGRLKCWGQNDCGQAGVPDVLGHIGDDPGEMGDNLSAVNLGTGKYPVAVEVGNDAVCALLNSGVLKCWGCNHAGQLGASDPYKGIDLGTGKQAVSIFLEYPRPCAILNDGTLKCWGLNSSGQLGQGHTMDLGSAAEMGDNLPIVHLYDYGW